MPPTTKGMWKKSPLAPFLVVVQSSLSKGMSPEPKWLRLAVKSLWPPPEPGRWKEKGSGGVSVSDDRLGVDRVAHLGN